MKEHFEDNGGGIFAPIVSPIISIAKGFVSIGELAGKIIKVFSDVLKLIPVILNPEKLLNDVIYGTITGITSTITAIFENILNLFGDSNSKTNSNDGVFGIENKNKQVCIKPTIINLVILILCPPLALFINKGWKSFFMIIVCALMTYYMYYFPGFLFAALHILC